LVKKIISENIFEEFTTDDGGRTTTYDKWYKTWYTSAGYLRWNIYIKCILNSICSY